jgi:hypothetical protein
MFRARQLLPATRPLCKTSMDSASAFTPTRSGRYLLSCPFNFRPSSPSFLLRVDAKLTKLTRVTHNPFVCHSYEKHPGVGYTRQSPAVPFSPTGPCPTRTNPRNPFSFMELLHTSLDTRGWGDLVLTNGRRNAPSKTCYPATGVDAGAFSICVKANCPQAAITSRPREYRVNTGTPRSSKIL